MKFQDACDKAEIKGLRIKPAGTAHWWELLPAGPGLSRFMIKNPVSGEFKVPSIYPLELRGEWEVEPEPEVKPSPDFSKKAMISQQRFDSIVARVRSMLFEEKQAG